MKDEGLQSVFFYLSKVVIIVPLIVIVTGLIFKFNQTLVSKKLEKAPPIITPTTSTAIKDKPTSTPLSKEIEFNLQGPMECSFVSPTTSLRAYIKNRRILLELKNKGLVEEFLVSGDCLYKWEKNSFSGKKICGISPVLSLAESLSGFSNFGIGNLFKMMPQLGIETLGSSGEAALDSLFQTCKKKDVEDSNLIIPKNILFKNAELKDIVD